MSIDYLMHVGICVSDLDRSVRFYRDVLGFREAGHLELDGEPTATLLGLDELELRAVYLERDGFRIELIHYPRPGTVGPADARPMNQLGLTHFTLRVTDLDETLRQVEAHGGSVLEKTRIHSQELDAPIDAIYALDPDGTRLELAETSKDPTR